jgi:hypothetical protein
MTLIATWFSEHRRAQHPLDPHYPLGLLFDASGGRPYCEVALEYPAPCVGKWIVKCYVCGLLAIVSAAGRSAHRAPRVQAQGTDMTLRRPLPIRARCGGAAVSAAARSNAWPKSTPSARSRSTAVPYGP